MICIEGDLRTNAQDFDLIMADEARCLVGSAPGDDDPIIIVACAQHGPPQSPDKSEQDHEDHRDQRDSHHGHQRGRSPLDQAPSVVAQWNHLLSPRESLDLRR
jgi:hypothetical protein